MNYLVNLLNSIIFTIINIFIRMYECTTYYVVIGVIYLFIFFNKTSHKLNNLII